MPNNKSERPESRQTTPDAQGTNPKAIPEPIIHPGDSLIVRRARKELVPVLDQLIECRDTLRKIHKRLYRIDKGTSTTVEGWIGTETECARDDCTRAIQSLRRATSSDYRLDAQEAIKDQATSTARCDRVVSLVAEIKQRKGEGQEVTELQNELIPLTSYGTKYANENGTGYVVEVMSSLYGLTVDEIEAARGCFLWERPLIVEGAA